MANAQKLARGFDLLASIYDTGVFMVFGKTLLILQKELVDQVAPVSTCLIVGGGTGAILRYGMDIQLANRYYYAELSGAMIKKTKNRLSTNEIGIVRFSQDVYSIDNQIKYDLILLPFVLDCYESQEVQSMLIHFTSRLESNGKIGVIDFNNDSIDGLKPRFWQHIITRLLYLFFRFTVGLKPKRLPPIIPILKDSGLNCVWNKSKYNAWLQASVWAKIIEEE